MPEEVLTVAELERLAAQVEGYASQPELAYNYWFAALARVCRHALALEAEVARLRRQIEGQRHEVHEDDGEQ
jgi:hypothetical protein